MAQPIVMHKNSPVRQNSHTCPLSVVLLKHHIFRTHIYDYPRIVVTGCGISPSPLRYQEPPSAVVTAGDDEARYTAAAAAAEPRISGSVYLRHPLNDASAISRSDVTRRRYES
jgi:hypothetical protein